MEKNLLGILQKKGTKRIRRNHRRYRGEEENGETF